jgi:Flp pilus assembly pilin Flp
MRAAVRIVAGLAVVGALSMVGATAAFADAKGEFTVHPDASATEYGVVHSDATAIEYGLLSNGIEY